MKSEIKDIKKISFGNNVNEEPRKKAKMSIVKPAEPYGSTAAGQKSVNAFDKRCFCGNIPAVQKLRFRFSKNKKYEREEVKKIKALKAVKNLQGLISQKRMRSWIPHLLS